MNFISKKFITATFCMLSLTASSLIYANERVNNATESTHKIFTPQSMKWSSGPNSLPKGAQITLLEGDPSKAGPFTLRLKFPANYRIPPHWHPSIEHLTIISGNLYLGMGDKFDVKEAKQLSPGSFGFMPPHINHFAFTRTPTIVQLHGEGPWGITYINPQDDPRNRR